jgi:micrococcal nuclease
MTTADIAKHVQEVAGFSEHEAEALLEQILELSNLLFGKDVRVETHGRYKHRRTLGTVFRGQVNVNQELVKEGWCWWFSKYVPKGPVLKQLEQEAKDSRKGLGADSNPTPPWLYRRLDKGAYP